MIIAFSVNTARTGTLIKQSGWKTFLIFRGHGSNKYIIKPSPIRKMAAQINLGNIQEEIYELSNKLIEMLKSDTGLDKVSKKLDRFYELDWRGFENELSKKKTSFTGKQKDDWFDRFNRMSKKVKVLNEKIQKTDDEIDKMVYKLYGITDKEKEIIEKSLA